MADDAPTSSAAELLPRQLRSIILASSTGTLIEWYDFFVFGSLSTTLASKFFPTGDANIGLLLWLSTYATGFLVRPFGALFFGRMGDLVGRKHTFLWTLVTMGLSTCAVGLVPTYAQIGLAAPLLLVLLRLIQGLALGGEYGGAATYVAEHAPRNKRGYYTSFIQTTATLGLLLSIIVVIGGQITMKAAFDEWGWRLAFGLSFFLLIFSFLIRRKMNESPLFLAMKAEGRQSKNPWRESFLDKKNRRLVLLALFGATAGQGVVWYTGQFYSLLFLQSEMKMEKVQANIAVAIALVLATPLFVLFGHFSDKYGRKKVMMTGLALAVLCYWPIFFSIHGLLDTSPASNREIIDVQTHHVMAQTKLTEDDGRMKMKKGDMVLEAQNIMSFTGGITANRIMRNRIIRQPDLDKEFSITDKDKKLDPEIFAAVVSLIFGLVACVTLVYAPIAAFLVEMFPTRIRYSSMSVPYHIGNGVFGGFVPVVATALVAKTGQYMACIWYPVGVAFMSLVIGSIWLKDRHGVDLSVDDGAVPAEDPA